MNEFEILKKLISFNTIDDQENEKIINYIANYLEKIGFKNQIINGKKGKCLISNYKEPNLCFLGHTDTVSYNDWTYNPFDLTIKDDKLYGLGVCDMKGGISSFLEALNEIDLNKLKKGLQVVLTYDEEKEFEGIKEIINYSDFIANNVLIGEPTNLVPVVSTKGCIEYKVSFYGKSCHSSNVIKGDNAILKCNNFINDLNKFYKKIQKDNNALFEIPYPTMNIAIINGGSRINIVPDECSLLFDFRTINKKEHILIKKQIMKLVLKYDAKLEELTNIFPLENNSCDISFYEEITNKKIKSFNYATEASFLDKENIVILGVGPDTSHQKDEYININSYNKTIELYKEVIKKYCE